MGIFRILQPGKIIVLLLFMSFSFCLEGMTQDDVINNVRTALKAGSSKELSQYFGSMVELNFDGEKSSYSRSQAEFVLKDFFKKNPPVDFQYIHQGESKQGFKYIIGKYSVTNGSFRIWILFKKDENTYYVDSIDFTRE